MKRRATLVPMAIALAVVLSGCTPTSDEPEVIIYPTYPEQESQSSPRYDLSSESNSKPVTYTSETVKPSDDVDNNLVNPDDLPDGLAESVVFDVKPPVAGEPFVTKLTFKSKREGYFVGVAADGSYTEPIGYFDEPEDSVAVLGASGKSETVAVKAFGEGQWSMDVIALSQLPTFDKKQEGTGSTAFVVNGETQNVAVKSEGTGIIIRSYGYQNRVILNRTTGGGSQTADTALPGNGSIITVQYSGEWSIDKAKEVPVDEESK